MNPPTSLRDHQATASSLLAALTAYEPLARRCVGSTDPWEEFFHFNVQEALATTLAPLRKEISAALRGLDDIGTLQQAWTLAIAKPLWTGMLYRAFIRPSDLNAEEPSPLVQEAQRLRALTVNRWEASITMHFEMQTSEYQIARLLLGLPAPEEAPPDFGDHTRLEGRARLRFRLAHNFRGGASLGKLLGLAARQRAVTPSQRRHEMARALGHAERSGRRMHPLGEHAFTLLDEKARALALALQPCWHVLLSRPLQEHRNLPRFGRELDLERARVQTLLSSVMQAVRTRRLGEVDALVRAIGAGPIARHLARGLAEVPWGLHDDPGHPARKEEFGPWVPMTQAAFAALQGWAPRDLPHWWAMSASELARWLAANGHDAINSPTPNLLSQDLAPLQRTWTGQETLAIIRAGHGRLVRSSSRAWGELTLEELASLGARLFQQGRAQLARRLHRLTDARPWLDLMASKRREDGSWDESAARALRDLAQETLELHSRNHWATTWCFWVAQAIGTPEWYAVRTVALERTCPLSDITNALSQRVPPVDAQAMRVAVAHSLHDPQLLPRRPVRELLRWIKLDPQAAPVVVEYGPPTLVLKAASEPGPEAGLLRAALGAAP